MTDNELVKIFLRGNYTRAQAGRRLRILRDFLNFKLFQKQSMEDSKANEILVIEEFTKKNLETQDFEYAEDDKQFLEALGSEFIKSFNDNNLNLKLSELEKGLKKGKQIIVYMPIEMNQQEVYKLGLWFKTNVSEDTLIDLEYDPKLIGGLAMSYNGVYKDYSLRSRIEAQKGEILRTLMQFRK